MEIACSMQLMVCLPHSSESREMSVRDPSLSFVGETYAQESRRDSSTQQLQPLALSWQLGSGSHRQLLGGSG